MRGPGSTVNDGTPATTAVDAQSNDPSSVSPVDFVADCTASAAVAFPPTVPGAAEDPRLTSEELSVWLSLLRLADLLPQALDRFLRQHTGIGHSYHQVLAMLSAAPDQRLRMSELASGTRTSKSRLSHAVACLEERGLVSRCSDTTDRRGRIARLTPAGRRFLDQTAPYHAIAARRLAFDQLGPDEVEQLRSLTAKLLDGAPTALLQARSLTVSPETEAPSCAVTVTAESLGNVALTRRPEVPDLVEVPSPARGLPDHCEESQRASDTGVAGRSDRSADT
jgi:DNA-binding MarR family transcriptional regulator